MNITQIGLPVKGSEQMAEKLNILLSNFQVHYQNLRGLHWNLRGRDFFELHVKFEEYYNDVQVKIDDLAERILTMGFTPKHTYQQYLDVTNIQAEQDVTEGVAGVKVVVNALSELLTIERDILALAGEQGDDGTADMMTQFIAQQEKEIWMLNAWLG